MDVWVVLGSMVAGALISECYHARMWDRYQQGKREGLKQREAVHDARSITIRK